MDPIFLAIDSLLKRFISAYKLEHGKLPTVNFDPPLPSKCTEDIGNDPDDLIRFWRPVERGSTFSFSNLETSLEFSFRPELTVFYGSFWSDCINVLHDSGLVFNIIQLWNEEDEERLKENMLGHLFAKQKNRLPLNYFIGSSDGNDVICLDHESGQIVLEKPGYEPHEILSPSLEQFLINLKINN